MNTIRLQLIDGDFYPTDSMSRDTLRDLLHIDRFPDFRLDSLSPKLIKMGYRLAVTGYAPKTYQRSVPMGEKMGEIKPTKNPCSHCYLKGICDSDECGRKNYRLFT